MRPLRQDDDKINIRLPDGLRDRLKGRAASNGRSMNAEIVAMLDASFNSPIQIDPEIFALIDEHINRKVAERLSEIARTLGGGDGKA